MRHPAYHIQGFFRIGHPFSELRAPGGSRGYYQRPVLQVSRLYGLSFPFRERVRPGYDRRPWLPVHQDRFDIGVRKWLHHYREIAQSFVYPVYYLVRGPCPEIILYMRIPLVKSGDPAGQQMRPVALHRSKVDPAVETAAHFRDIIL